MYFSLNQEKIVFDQSSGITIRVNGPEDFYYVEVREFLPNKNESYFLDGYAISFTGEQNLDTEFRLPLLFYSDLETTIYKFLDGKKTTKIFTHRYNDYGKLVKFVFESEDINDCEIWYDKVMEYQSLHGCKSIIDSPFDEINKKSDNFYRVHSIDYYKTYYLGRYPKTEEEWKPRQPIQEAVFRKENWNPFWSFRHPKNWENLSPAEIADDILGLKLF